MNDRLLVRGLQRARDLIGDGNGFVDGHWSASKPMRQSRAFDEFQHERVHAAEIFEAVDRGMLG